MTLVAGVDSSTQSCKLVVRELESGTRVRSAVEPHVSGSEVDPAVWWRALERALDAVGGVRSVAAISIAAQQHGMVALDRSGRVIRPALLWNDTRSAPAAAALAAELGAAELARRTGSLPLAAFTLAKLRWLRDNEPQNAARVAAVALPHDWLSWRLRGYGPAGEASLGPDLDALSSDRSDASGTGYFSPQAGAYDRALLALALGQGDAVLPRIVAPGQRAGSTPEGVVVGAGAGDNAAAALGLRAVRGEAIVSIGTSGTVFASSERPTADPSGVVAGFADATGRYLPLVCTLNAARVLSSTATLLGVGLERLSALALAAAPGAGGAVLVPYFEGERTPNLPDASASLHGLTIASCTPENVARAAVEGMLCGLADGLDALRELGVSVSRLLLVGGGARSEAVRRIAAQVFDLPVLVPSPGEYVADGAAVQAAWALTGNEPEWPRALAQAPGVDHRPETRAQYARYASSAQALY